MWNSESLKTVAEMYVNMGAFWAHLGHKKCKKGGRKLWIIVEIRHHLSWGQIRDNTEDLVLCADDLSGVR